MDAARDYLFCPTTGALLHLDAARDVARCPLSGWQKSLQGAEQRKQAVLCLLLPHQRDSSTQLYGSWTQSCRT
jgi:hypothetical protein